jgi:hypothetical protein
MEIETAESTTSVPDEETGNKGYAVSQFADAEAAMTKREQTCFSQLERSLLLRLPEAPMACSEWIQKSKVSSLSSRQFILKSVEAEAPLLGESDREQKPPPIHANELKGYQLIGIACWVEASKL